MRCARYTWPAASSQHPTPSKRCRRFAHEGLAWPGWARGSGAYFMVHASQVLRVLVCAMFAMFAEMSARALRWSADCTRGLGLAHKSDVDHDGRCRCYVLEWYAEVLEINARWIYIFVGVRVCVFGASGDDEHAVFRIETTLF